MPPPPLAPPEEFASLPGQPVAAMAAHPAIGPRLRAMAAGRQRLVAEALRGRGPAVVWEGGWLSGWAAAGELRCFLAYEPRAEQVALMLWEGNRPSLFIPPRWAPWPEALRPALRRFNPEIEAQLRFG
ncbi:MAG: hypothetical protein RMK64_03520 [Rhodovarius sp.]|nr:hypothetical protein [Rhodovarius sp.]MCX7931517.1 hypothetical protein [Rhodovarius sp.]MDW8314019.1 hypothetical protein [Rhodovarius sp.]